jgi:hypothetical protein
VTDALQPVTAVVDRRIVSGAATAVASATVLAITSMGDRDGLVVCPLRLCTGTYCPGCGGSRAAAELVRGDIVGAWQQHPYVVLLAGQVLLLAGLATRTGGRAWLARRWVALLVANTAAMITIWVLRLGLGDIPSAL